MSVFVDHWIATRSEPELRAIVKAIADGAGVGTDWESSTPVLSGRDVVKIFEKAGGVGTDE